MLVISLLVLTLVVVLVHLFIKGEEEEVNVVCTHDDEYYDLTMEHDLVLYDEDCYNKAFIAYEEMLIGYDSDAYDDEEKVVLRHHRRSRQHGVDEEETAASVRATVKRHNKHVIDNTWNMMQTHIDPQYSHRAPRPAWRSYSNDENECLD